MVLLIIAGVVTLITLIASATTSSLALAKEVQTSSYVNHLAENVTNALSIQENLDRQLEQRTNALDDKVQIIGDEAQVMKAKSNLE